MRGEGLVLGEGGLPRAQLWMTGRGVACAAQFWEDRSVAQGGRGVWTPVLQAGVGRCGRGGHGARLADCGPGSRDGVSVGA